MLCWDAKLRSGTLVSQQTTFWHSCLLQSQATSKSSEYHLNFSVNQAFKNESVLMYAQNYPKFISYFYDELLIREMKQHIYNQAKTKSS